MELTKEYLLEQEDCIKRNFDGYKNLRVSLASRIRLDIIKHISKGSKTILSVGSGGFEPTYINSTHAVDVHKVAEEILRAHGWKGEFKLGSCDNIPYPDKSMDFAICSEVIEHLPSKEIVRNTFLEVDRVGKRWVITTPTKWVGEPTHKFVFSFQDLVSFTHGLKVHIEKKGPFWYVHKSERTVFNK